MAKERKKLSRKSLDEVREFKSKMLSREYLVLWGAHAMGIGRKVVNGKPTDKACVRIFVESKQKSERLGRNQEVPPYFTFQPEKSSRSVRIYTDVIEVPMARFEPVDPETKIRPAPGGVSGGIMGSTGTIGGYVWDNTDDSIVMLSNHHVLWHTPGTTIIQQGSADGGSIPANNFGEVNRGIVRVSGGTINTVDCAIGDPDDVDDIDLSVIDIGPAVYAIDVAENDMLVEKYGQTTRHTYGEITDDDWEGMVDGIYYFEQCFRVDKRAPSTDWSDSGDSGSLVFSQTPISKESEIKPVVGLHFAGASTYGIGCHIQSVFDALDLTTLCAGAFSSFLDSLFGRESESESDDEVLEAMTSMAAMQPVRKVPAPLLRKARQKRSSDNLYAGISRDIQKQLKASPRGKQVVDLVNAHRHELLTLVAKDGDVRRSAIRAVSTLAHGTVTSSEFLAKRITKNDIANFERLAKELSRKGGRKIKLAVNTMLPFLDRAEGKSVRSILKVNG